MVKTDFVHKVMQCHKLQRSDIMVTCGSKLLISFLIIHYNNGDVLPVLGDISF